MQPLMEEVAFPATYGEVLKPLDLAVLTPDLAQLYRDDDQFREWVHVFDRVRRAEKISSWTQWTPEQEAAYEAGDCAAFSRLRGYAENEISDFLRELELIAELNAKHGDYFCMDVSFLLWQAAATEQLHDINDQLHQLSERALARNDANTKTIPPQKS